MLCRIFRLEVIKMATEILRSEPIQPSFYYRRPYFLVGNPEMSVLGLILHIVDENHVNDFNRDFQLESDYNHLIE